MLTQTLRFCSSFQHDLIRPNEKNRLFTVTSKGFVQFKDIEQRVQNSVVENSSLNILPRFKVFSTLWPNKLTDYQRQVSL